MAYSEDLKQYAKKLYLEIDENGESAHSQSDIARLINKECKKKVKKGKTITPKLIHDWVHREGWEEELVRAKNLVLLEVQKRKTAAEAKALNDRQELLKLASTTFEIDKSNNDELHGLLGEILKSKAKFSKMFYEKTYEDEGYTKEQINELRLTTIQETQVYRIVNDTKLKHTEIVSNSAVTTDKELNVNINILGDDDEQKDE